LPASGRKIGRVANKLRLYLEGKTIITDKKILYVSSISWVDLKDEHIMIEMLSGANDIVWIDPYGPLSGPIAPHIYKVKEGLTVYHPGINFLALPFLRLLNQRRRLLQVNLYLVGREFIPDIVWIEDPLASRFALHYGKKGALTLYYAAKRDAEEHIRSESDRLSKKVNLVYKPGELPAEMTEEKFSAALNERLEDISRLIEAIKGQVVLK
jgi:hypothetical protein